MQGLLSAPHKKKEHAQADLFLALYLNEHLALLTCKNACSSSVCSHRSGEMLKICFLSIVNVQDLFSRNKLGYTSTAAFKGRAKSQLKKHQTHPNITLMFQLQNMD